MKQLSEKLRGLVYLCPEKTGDTVGMCIPMDICTIVRAKTAKTTELTENHQSIGQGYFLHL